MNDCTPVPTRLPVCEAKTATEHHCNLDNHAYLRCVGCDLVFQGGTTDLDTMTSCYTGGQFKRWRRQLLNGFRKIERQRDFNSRMDRARAIFNFSKARKPLAKGTYLDIGCNKGFNIYAAEEQGWDAYGNELIEEIIVPIKNSKPHLKSRIKLGSFVDLASQYEDRTFDLITCIDVIEHLTEPKFAMEQMVRITKPDGVVIFQTPDATKPNIALRDQWKALKPNEHLLLFNPNNFEKMALNAGFKCVTFAEQPFDYGDGNFVAVCCK